MRRSYFVCLLLALDASYVYSYRYKQAAPNDELGVEPRGPRNRLIRLRRGSGLSPTSKSSKDANKQAQAKTCHRLFVPDCPFSPPLTGKADAVLHSSSLPQVDLTFFYPNNRPNSIENLSGRFSWSNFDNLPGIQIRVTVEDKVKKKIERFCLEINRNQSDMNCIIPQGTSDITWYFNSEYHIYVSPLGDVSNATGLYAATTSPDCIGDNCLFPVPAAPKDLKFTQTNLTEKVYAGILTWTPAIHPEGQKIDSTIIRYRCLIIGRSCRLEEKTVEPNANRMELTLSLPGPYIIMVKQMGDPHSTILDGWGTVSQIPARAVFPPTYQSTVVSTTREDETTIMTMTTMTTPTSPREAPSSSLLSIVITASGVMSGIAVIVVIIIIMWSYYVKKKKKEAGYRLRRSVSTDSGEEEIPSGGFLAHPDQTVLRRMVSDYQRQETDCNNDDCPDFHFDSKLLVVYSTSAKTTTTSKDTSHAKRCRKIVHQFHSKLKVRATSHEFEEQHARADISRWAQYAITRAEHIIVVCSESLDNDFNSDNRGTGNEQITRQLCHYIRALYVDQRRDCSQKCIPVILSAKDRNYVPRMMMWQTVYCWAKQSDVNRVIQIVTNQQRKRCAIL